MSIIAGVGTIAKEVGEAIGREVDFHLIKPTIATIFITYRCNSRCKTCTMWQRPVKEEMAKEIGLDEWIAICDKLFDAGVRVMEVFGGNVLLRKDILIPLLEYLHEKGFYTHLPTNQIGLDDEIAVAIARYTYMVYISTDGVGDSQDEIRGQKGAAGRLEPALEMLKRHKKGDYPQLVCNTTVSRFNVRILEQIAEQAVERGFDQLHFEYVGEFSPEVIEASKIDGLTPKPYYVKEKESVLLSAEEARLLKKTLERIKKRFARKITIYTTNIDILSEQNLSEGTIPNSKCYVARNEVTVDPYGDVVGCLFINNYIYGSLLTEDFDSLWKSKKQRRFIEAQGKGEMKMCEHCILGAQRNPTFLRSMKRIYLSRVEPKLKGY